MATTKAPYGEELVSKGLGLVETAQQIALTAVQKSVEGVRSVAPQAHDALAKVDFVDTKHAVDSAFEVAQRVLASQRAFAGDVLSSVLDKPAPPKKTAAA
jgi:hypothetical protein